MAEKKDNQAKKKPEKKSPAGKEISGEKKSQAGNNHKNKKDFLVVGIGASAGGVAALQDFFATMPPNSGMAFVVILHLSPQHESNLAQILQARTTMPVVQVQETHTVEPNHVYVIPPNQNLEMIDGVVRIANPDKTRGFRVAIDIFFRTLADAYERNAVCIVLSGTGSDGTLGLKRVKERNGFAIVQEPLDAEFEEMPRNAIATGLADWVLPVAQMPEKLINFRESSERLHLTQGDDGKVAREIQAEKSLREILTLLRVRTGHDFSNYKTPTLIRRIARHLQIHELEDIPSYLAFLREHPDEIQSLQRNLLINVTNFFRDKDAFFALEREVIPALFDEKGARDTVRVWCAGCASGEEAYSLAILLHEYAEKLNDPPKLQVFATDVDDEAIHQAREHLYPETIKTDVSENRLKRYFVHEGSNYRVKKEIREMVLFAPHNLLRDPPFSKLDLITCRNVLIYLNRETQERLMEIFHFALNHNGYLFLGTSETAENVPTLFSIVDKKYRLYSRRPSQNAIIVPPRMPFAGQWQINLPAGVTKQKTGEAAFSLGEVHYKLLEKFAPPSVLLNQDLDVLYMSEEAGRYLKFKGGEPSRNILKLVNPDILPDLRAALFAAQREHRDSEFQNISAEIEGKETFVNISVRTVDTEDDGRDFLLVVFNEEGREKFVPRKKENGKRGATAERKRSDARDTVVERLEEELQRTKDNLRATIEQHEISIEELKASNEELQAINEELRSASEELETSKEEAQSVNEELTTVNSELKDKIDEATGINSDLQNLMASTDIATIFLDKNLRIKRYTPQVEEFFNITAGDVGRPLEHFTHKLEYENLSEDAAHVLRSLLPVEREVPDKKGRFFIVRFLPYRTLEDKIDGIVINFLDITERKAAEMIIDEDLRNTRLLRELSVQFVPNGEIQEIYDRVLEAAVEIARADAGTIQILDENSRELVLLAAKNFPPEMTGHFARVDAGSETSCGIALKTGERTFVDYDAKGVKDKDGSLRMHREMGLLSAQSTPLVSRSGKPIGMFSTHWRRHYRPSERQIYFLDLLARQAADLIIQWQVENALRESEEKFRTLSELAPVLIWFDDPEGNCLYVNRQYLEFSGKTAEELAGEGWQMVLHPDDADKCISDLRKAQRERRPFHHTVRAKRQDGEWRWLESNAKPLFGSNGTFLGHVGISSDITDRKKADEIVRKSEEQLRLVMESTKDYAIITFDLDGKITRWNRGAEKIFGWTEKEAAGQTTHLIFTPEDRAEGVPEREMDKALREGKAEDERWHIRKNGSRFYASGMMQILKDGELEGFVKIARDETQRLLAEQAQREKEMLQQFVHTQEDERRRIARDIHDQLGQQLTALRFKVSSLDKMCEENNFSGKKKASAEIKELQKIIEQLDRDVDFLAWELRPASLDDLGLRLTLQNFVKEWANYTGIETRFHTSGLGKIHSMLSTEAETNLYRIAQEALNNVLKHAKAKNVSVLLEKRNGNAVLIIEDDGRGFNATNKLKRPQGLGLVGMRERATLLGGEFEIESAPGKGTTIFVRVPVSVNLSKR